MKCHGVELLTDLDDLVGKTITNVGMVYDEVLYLVADDSSILVMGIDAGYDSPSVEIINRPDPDVLHAAGLLTKDELDAIRIAEWESHQEKLRASELEQLSRLKSKYEGN